MGSTVFGTPVTTETLMVMAEFHDKTIRAVDRARVAMELKNAQGKDVNAREHVVGLLDAFRSKQQGGGQGTMCLLYNATGDPVTYYAHNNWSGSVYLSSYPAVIENGQWGAFLHSQFLTPSAKGGVAYVGTTNSSFTGANQSGLYVFTWRQRNDIDTNTCMTRVVAEAPSVAWPNYDPEGLLSVSSHRWASTVGSGLSFASIGSGNGSLASRSPIFEGIMTLADGVMLENMNARVDPDPAVDASVEGTTTLMDGVELRNPYVNADADAE